MYYPRDLTRREYRERHRQHRIDLKKSNPVTYWFVVCMTAFILIYLTILLWPRKR